VGLGVLGYAARSVVRNRRASASALIGIALGVAVATAPWVALDSTLQGIYDSYLDALPFDAEAFGSPESVDEAATALASIDHVREAEPVVYVFARLNASATGVPGNLTDTYVQFVRPTFSAVADSLGFTWTQPPVPGGVLVDGRLRDAGLGPGDTLVFEHRVPIYDNNGTQIGEDVFTGNLTVGGSWENGEGFLGGILASEADRPRFFSDLNVTYEASGTIYVWIDREAVLDAFDTAGSTARLRRLENLAGANLGPYGYYFQWARPSGVPSLGELPAWIEGGTLILRLFFLAFAIPTLAMSYLLAKVGFDIGLARRRRELAVLRARGITVSRVRLLLLTEAILLSLPAAILGILLALGLSRLFTVPIAGILPTSPTFAISAGSVGLGVGIAALLAVGASRRAVHLVATEDLVRSLKSFHADEVAIPYRASRDFLVAGVGAAGFLLILAFGATKGGPLSILTFILGFATAILAPMAPFFLVIGVTRYLTRGTTRPYRALALLLRRSLGELYILVDRNLARSPRRSSNTAMIVTFAVAFVFAVQIFAASSNAYREEGILRSTPSDIVVDAYGYPGIVNDTTQAAVRSVPGVDSVTGAVPLYSEQGSTVFFDAATYLETVPWIEARHVGGIDPSDLMRDLADGEGFLANSAFHQRFGLEPGDLARFVVHPPDGIGYVNATLRAIVPPLPLPGVDGESEPISYLDLSALPPDYNASAVSTATYLISLAPGTDSRVAAAAISKVLGGAVNVRTQDEARRMEAANPVASAVFGYLSSQGQIAVGLLVVAVGLLVYSAAVERRDELATLVARGAGTRSVGRLVMAEGIVVSLLGLLLGVVAGLVTAGTFLALISSVVSPPVPFVVPLAVVIPLVGVVLGVWLASFLGALTIQRMDVARVLKLRGG